MALGTAKLASSTFRSLKGRCPEVNNGRAVIAAMEGCGGKEGTTNTWLEDEM